MLQGKKKPVFMRLLEKFKVLHCGVTRCYGVTLFLRYAQKHIKNLVKMTCDCEFCDCERVIINYSKSKGMRT